jgi:hypothetical protein
MVNKELLQDHLVSIIMATLNAEKYLNLEELYTIAH